MSTFVVGDIHGGLRALEQVLERMNYSENDRFIFVGDYVDGWSDNAETVDFLLKFSEKQECIFIRGNHDELVYNFLNKKENNPVWLAHGGESSKKSYAKLSEAEIEKHIVFYKNLINYYIDEKNRLFLHAGFTNLKGPQFEYFETMVYWDRTLWEMVCTMDHNMDEDDDRFPKRLKLFHEIYIGHTPTTRIGFNTPVNFYNVWNVDTGAAFKGPLSVMDIDTKMIWQSDPVYTLYPEETGRN
ncbi:metallophosphoesterase family protein [Constantimarinum furrinae]|uniref:Serine/threonine protein phosphatase 1 n=1 Tax=Constantimarinum furrinae TaxID=2562285 RepID=A0A7G8PTC8_9FLAO|nr:metallophosphoesterase family protein [Constantimarinum furrinae]QNJ97594.1 serine/threonine protein phosphatase 1 [Constantimarinum furrinae]